MLQATLIYLAAVNAATFALFALDKRRAIFDQRRIPECSLLTYAALGGVLGAVAAQRMFRHKTRKEPFRTYLMAIFVVWTGLTVALFVPEIRANALAAIGGFLRG